MLTKRRVMIVGILAAVSGVASAAGKGSGLTAKEIVDTVNSYQADAKECYQRALDKDKTAEGKVKIRFLIGLQGKIEASQIEKNTFKDKVVGDCLRDKMKAWKFPKPRQEEKVNTAYPFEFKTAPAPAEPESPAPGPDAAAPAPAQNTPAAEPAAPAVPEKK